jgi:RES domain-containing protein
MSESYYKTPFSTSGNAARWNPKGQRMIYAASSPTVALLEYLCIKGSAVASKQWYMIVYEIVDETLIAQLEPTNLPADWSAVPHTRGTQELGRIWLEGNQEPFLKVPSARIGLVFYPMEFNILINPDYPDVTNVCKPIDTLPFNYLLNW